MNDKQLASLTVSDLSKLTQVQANVGGTDETGPTLLSVLNSIGVTDYTELTFYGYSKGRVATAELTLKKSDVTENMMLALVARGTVKFTGTDIGAQRAIVDLNRIAIK